MRAVALIQIVFLSAAACRAQTPSETPVGLVQTLYRDFAWEADPHLPQGKDGFEWQPQSVLTRYFDASLADLMIKDQKCVTESQSECALGFKVLWDSQDPESAEASIEPTGDSSAVKVTVRYSREFRVLTYRLERTSAGWRIYDIEFASARSLRQLLQSQ